MNSEFRSNAMPSFLAHRLAPVLLVLGLCGVAPLRATDLFNNIVWDTATASVQQGLLEHGPNAICDTLYPGSFSFRNNDPGEDHLYHSYDFYNSGPERCVKVILDWTGDDCGDLEIGIALYLGSFNPSDPTLNLISHSYNNALQVPGFGGNEPNSYRYSPGFYRDNFQLYELDTIEASAVVPAYAHVVAVLDSTRQPGQPALTCPRSQAGSLRLYTDNLSDKAPEITVSDASQYEFGPAANQGGTLQFGVHLSIQSALPVTVNYTTVNGAGPNGAIAGVDYTAVSDTLTFTPGETFKYVPVSILGDAMTESNKTLALQLSNSNPPGFVIADATATGTILDDDSLVGTCHIASPGSLPPGVAGQPYGPVDLIPDAEVAGDFTWSLVDPNCLPPNLTLSEGANQHGVIQGTPTVSGTFNCTIHLVCPTSDSGTESHDTPFTLVIEPEAPQVLITLEGASTLEGNAGTTPVLPHIHLSSPAAQAFNLEVVLFDASATTSNADYVPLAPGQQIGVNAGDVDVPIPLDAVGDPTIESDEIFLVQVRTPTTHEVIDTAPVTIINDDAPIAAIPTLGEWGMAALVLALAGLAIAKLRAGG